MRRHMHSLRFRLSLFCWFLIVALLLLLGFNSYNAMRAIRQETYEAMRSTVSMQCSRLERGFASAETYLAGFAYDNAGINALETNPRETSEWFSALRRLQMNFDSAVTVHMVDNFFLYTPDSSLFVNGSVGVQANLRDVLCKSINDGVFFQPENAGCWTPLSVDGIYYLARVLKIHNSFVGAWIRVDHTSSKLFGSSEQELYFDFGTADGTLLSTAAPIRQLKGFTPDTQDTYRFVTLNGEAQLLITMLIPRTHLSLTTFVPDTKLQRTVNLYRNETLVVLSVVLLLLFTGAIMIQKWVMHPISALTSAIQRLRDGDVNATVNRKSDCTEFKDMNLIFNEMVKEIKTLKIGVYEEQLRGKQAEIEYLKLQITPHFLVNCLNTVYQLTEAGRPDLSQQMIRNLSAYLRYILSSGLTVPLVSEIKHVEDYIEMSSIRYPGCLRLEMEYDPEILQCNAIPLLILNFIENTIKYEVTMEKTIEIHISAHLAQDRDGMVHLCIWDTGGGFSQEMLESLRDTEQYVKENQSRHIGISNVFQRAHWVLGDCAFLFSNRSGAGAQIDIYIPNLPYSGEEAAL